MKEIRKGIKMQTLRILLGIIAFIAIWALIERKQLVTSRYTVESNKLPKEFHNTNIVVLADLHNCKFGKKNQRLVQRIDSLAPDFIIVAGDMINKKASCYPSNAFDLLDQLSNKYKIYYAYGNHEQRMEGYTLEKQDEELEDFTISWIEFKNHLQKKGVVFLDNETTVLRKNKESLNLSAISIDRRYFERYKMPEMEENYLNSLIGNHKKDYYHILIAHNPVYFSTYAIWGADLTISGHLHGGLVRLPGLGGVISPQVKLFPKYQAGNFMKDGQQMVVSRGLGSHSYMPRLFNAPEIVNITLKYKA